MGGLVLDLGRPGFFRLVLREEFPRDFLEGRHNQPSEPSSLLSLQVLEGP